MAFATAFAAALAPALTAAIAAALVAMFTAAARCFSGVVLRTGKWFVGEVILPDGFFCLLELMLLVFCFCFTFLFCFGIQRFGVFRCGSFCLAAACSVPVWCVVLVAVCGASLLFVVFRFFVFGKLLCFAAVLCLCCCESVVV